MSNKNENKKHSIIKRYLDYKKNEHSMKTRNKKIINKILNIFLLNKKIKYKINNNHDSFGSLHYLLLVVNEYPPHHVVMLSILND